MPLYAYQCDAGHRFEELQRFSDAPVSRCECGAPTRRVLSASTIIFRGPGFHNTDYGTRRRPKQTT